MSRLTTTNAVDTIAEAADVIVVGGGAAGAVLAARLSEDPRRSVLVLEAGPENDEEATQYVAGAYATWFGPLNWGYRTVPQAGLAGRSLESPRGRLMGGSAAINAGSWSRGIGADYDDWENAGATGWGWSSALAWYQQIEHSDRGDSSHRGAAGPMQLETMPIGSYMTEVLRQASLESGLGATTDHNGAQATGFDRWETIFPAGRRRNTATAYLEPARARANLRIATDALVQRVVIRDGRASGVVARVGRALVEFRVREEVVLAAGTYNTPQLLMLSGVGPAAHLAEHGIPVVLDAPEVGANLSEQLRAPVGAAAPPGIGVRFSADPGDIDQLTRWRRTGYGPLAVFENTSVAFTRSSPQVPHPDIELMLNINPPYAFRGDPERAGWMADVSLLRPASRGTVRLRSADPDDVPLIDPEALSAPEDVEIHLRGLRLAMSLGATRSLAPFTQDWLITPDADDAALTAHLRATADLSYHPIGTVRMGAPHDEAAPLDPSLRVKGVKGLRVADASAIPTQIRGHSMAPTIYVAERAAQMLIANGAGAPP